MCKMAVSISHSPWASLCTMARSSDTSSIFIMSMDDLVTVLLFDRSLNGAFLHRQTDGHKKISVFFLQFSNNSSNKANPGYLQVRGLILLEAEAEGVKWEWRERPVDFQDVLPFAVCEHVGGWGCRWLCSVGCVLMEYGWWYHDWCNVHKYSDLVWIGSDWEDSFWFIVRCMTR